MSRRAAAILLGISLAVPPSGIVAAEPPGRGIPTFEDGAVLLDESTCLDPSGDIGIVVVDTCWTLADYAAELSVEGLARRGIALPSWQHPDPLLRTIAARTVEPRSGEEPATFVDYFWGIVGSRAVPEPPQQPPAVEPPPPAESSPPPPEPAAGDVILLVDVARGLWHAGTGGAGVAPFSFGDPGDVPLLGDWDCDGFAAPGVFRPSTGMVYVAHGPGIGRAMGDAGDVPVVGDFDGDGCDTVSLYRPSEQRFYIFDSLAQSAGVASRWFVFGDPGDTPVAGDWDGDGRDGVALHRASTGLFYFRNTLTTGVAEGELYFGNPGDRFVGGDWGIVDGADSPAVFRPADATLYLRYSVSAGVADADYPGGEPAWVPVAGRLPPGR